MRLLLVSTYELGRQPVHLASPTAALSGNGIDVVPVDLAVEDWDPLLLEGVDAVALSVPMHTAMRLARSLVTTIHGLRPGLPVALYGLYAAVGAGHTADSTAVVRFAGEYEPALVQWATSLANGEPRARGVKTHLGPSPFQVPDRSGLPDHGRYARLEWMGESRLAAAVEGSHGCRHRCRHCPIPVLYDGRIRVVGAEAVLGDIDQLAGQGVRHVTFGDPDFLNAPRYSLDLLRAAHSDHPDLTFDVTVKVEHIVRHQRLWREMASLGVLFVVSAFESTDDRTLEILDKGHSVADMTRAVQIMRSEGIHIRPTWLPFLPWTEPGHLLDLVLFLDRNRLWSSTDPVQLAIKLLIPEGSLLERHPAVLSRLSAFDPASLGWAWTFESTLTARMHQELDAMAAEGSDCGAEAIVTLATMRDRIGALTDSALPPMPESPPVPRLTETWFCCAEPTAAQAAVVGLAMGRVPLTSD